MALKPGALANRVRHRFETILMETNADSRFKKILLQTKDDDRFIDAYKWCYERAFGKAPQQIDITGELTVKSKLIFVFEKQEQQQPITIAPLIEEKIAS